MLALLPVLATVHFDVHGDRLEATVKDAARVEPLFLRDIDDPRHPPKQARSVVPDLEGAESVALAIVIETNEMTMAGLYKPLRAALDHIALGKRLPPGSSVTLIGYDATVHELALWQDAAKISGADLGKLEDFHGLLGSELAEALTYARTQVALAGDDRAKLLLIIGDGNDSDPEQARAVLRPVRGSSEIPTFAIIVKTAASPDGDILGGIAQQRRVSTVDGVEAGLVAALDSLHQPFKATFDVEVPHDGKFHTLAIATSDSEIARDTIWLPADEPSGRPLWFYALVAAVVLGTGVAFFKGR